jgi:pimeloyl-ACP methyl ester carboxylesterase
MSDCNSKDFVENINLGDIELEVFRKGSGSPLLFLHSGLGFTPAEPWVDLLVGQGMEVIVPSHPGFGKSSLPEDFKTVEDLSYLYLDFIKRQHLEDVILVGASFGGWIALEVAIRCSHRLRALVLVDTVGVRFRQREEADIADVFLLSDDEFAELAYANPTAHRANYGNLNQEQLEIVARNRVALAQYAWSPYMNNPRLKRWLFRIEVPTQCIWGMLDKIVPVEYGRMIAAAIPGATISVLEDAGHFPHVECPQEFGRALSEFVATTKGLAA